MKLLLLAGAGTSIELGIPGMHGLGKDFRTHLRQWPIDLELVRRLSPDEELDVEYLIEELDHLCEARVPLESIGPNGIDMDRADSVRAEVEWFVQHAAERVVARDARLLWGSVLSGPQSVEIAFITTNYDRAIEMAANDEGISLDDGFPPFDGERPVFWKGFAPSDRHSMLVKLHGSTDWYVDNRTRRPVKLRHPMPLFGRSTLRLADGTELGSALVLPSREKLLTRAPYPRLSQAFFNATDSCDIALFIGSSLRDEHVREAAQSAARRVPTFIVNPDGDACGIEDAIAMPQHASTFLISTLPNALLASDVGGALQRAARELPPAGAGLLRIVGTLLDPRSPTNRRCESVDELDRMASTLPPSTLRRLLDDDDPAVARYSLGLIPASPLVTELIDHASRSRHAADEDFRTDLGLLRRIVGAESRSGD